MVSELDEIGRQTLEAYAQYEGDMPPAFWEAYAAELADARKRAEHGKVFAVELDGELAGSATMQWDESEPDTLYLKMVAVLPDARGAGIGRAVMDRAFEYARSEGARVLKWNTLSFMTPARRLYSRLGFEPDQADDLGENITLFTYRAPLLPGDE